MRGCLDFETWHWVNALCCGFMWGPPDDRRHFFLEDEGEPFRIPEMPKHTRSRELLCESLRTAHRLTGDHGISEWWAHNGGKFDFLLLVDAARFMGWRVYGHTAGGGRLIYMSARPDNSDVTCHFYDSFAVVSAALGKAAKGFELPHAKKFSKDDYRIDTRIWDREHLRTGCLTDCLLVLELLEKVENIVEGWGGKLRHTFSATALSIVRADLKQRGLKLPSHEGKQRCNDYAKQAYYGGRVEVLHHCPDYDLDGYDVNSSFPFSMAGRVPFELEREAQNRREVCKVLEGEIWDGPVEARVTVPDTLPFPPLPWRHPKGGIYFPTGTWTGVFPAVELRYAMELGCKVEPLSAIAYRVAQPFGDFVERVYEMKSTAKGAVRAFSKFLLNGCYGKFGQSPETESLAIVTSIEEGEHILLTHPPGKVGRLGDDPRYLLFRNMRWPPQTHFALAGHINAASRVLLNRGMYECPSVAYCDTDSLHVRRGQRPSNVGNALGAWKLDKGNYRAWFYAPKVYRMEMSGWDGKDLSTEGKLYLAAKGIPIRREDPEDPDRDIWDLDAFNRWVASERVPIHRMVLVKSQLRNNGGLAARQEDRRRWAGRSMKRAPLSDGSTRPWTVEELRAEKQFVAWSPLARSGPLGAEKRVRKRRGPVLGTPEGVTH